MRVGTAKKIRWAKRVGWLLLIWALSMAALYVVVLLIRVLMTVAGLVL